MTAVPTTAPALAPVRESIRHVRRVGVWPGVLLAGLDALSTVPVLAVLMLLDGGARAAASLLLVPAWLATLAVTGEYRQPLASAVRARRVLTASLVLSTPLLLVADGMGHPVSAATIVLACLGAGGSAIAGRALVQLAAAHGVGVPGLTRRLVLVGAGAALPDAVRRIRRHADRRLEVVAVCATDGEPGVFDVDLPVLSGLDRCVTGAAEIAADTVVVLPDERLDPVDVRRLQRSLEAVGTAFSVWCGLVDVAATRAGADSLCGLPMLRIRSPRRNGPAHVAMHAAERLAAAVALVALAPLLAVLVLAILCDTPGSPIFRQTRVGKDGRHFVLWKLRTMTRDAADAVAELADRDEGAGVLFKVRADPRVTRVGRWLRRTSLDELPQLVNVMLGQMSLVGPRPALPTEVGQYHADMRRRLDVRPGITGLWQVSGRSDLSWEESTRLDQYYVDNWSPVLDLMILARTIGAVVRGKGAY